MIGILCAMEEELGPLLTEEATLRSLADRTFHLTRINDQEVVIAQCGVGKVAAAIAATIMCQKFGCRTVINTGVAGGVTMKADRGEVIIAARTFQYDYGRDCPAGYTLYQPGALQVPGEEPQNPGYELDPRLVQQIEALDLPPTVKLGTLATADTFLTDVSHPNLRGRNVDAVDMEGAAIAQVAESFFAQWLVIKAISDEANEKADHNFRIVSMAASNHAVAVLHQVLPLFAE